MTLKVIPHIGEGGSVRLEVEQEVSNVENSKGQAADLVTSKRAIKTSVLADHGQTVVLGGLSLPIRLMLVTSKDCLFLGYSLSWSFVPFE